MAKAKTKIEDTEDKKTISSFDNVQRVFKGDMKVMIDTFKLKVATFKKNIAPDGKQFKPNYVPFEHAHIFHTRQENGKENLCCAPVGGHTHEVIIEVVDGKFVGRTSEPIQFRGSEKIAPKMDAQGRVIDNHTHEVEYLKSDEHTPKSVSPEVAKLYNAVYRPDTTPSDQYQVRNER
jgi:hypothetical protein